MAQIDQFAVSDAEYDVKANTILKESKLLAKDLNILADDITNLDGLVKLWNDGYAITKVAAQATPVDFAKKEANRETLTKFLRPYVQKYFYNNKGVTDAIIVKAGLRLHSDSKTKYGTPTEIPSFSITPLVGNSIGLVVRNEQGKKAKPAGVQFIRVRYFVGEDAPAEPDEFSKFKDFTSHPITIQFDKAQAGKNLTLAVCYVGTNASEGGYGLVVEVKVP